MAWLDELKKWVTPPSNPKKLDESVTPHIPRRGIVPAINYWRALQILKKTPFKELLVKAKEEAPHFIYLLVVFLICLVSVVFTAGYLIKTFIMFVLRGLYGIVTFFTGRGEK